MNIRRAQEKDTEKIKDLLCQVLNVHHRGRPDIFKENCRKYTDSELSEIIKDDLRPIFVAEGDSGIMGYAFCVLIVRQGNNILTDMKTLYIDDLCVDESSRGQHIGKSLYEYVKNYAKEIGCYNVTLNVWAFNEDAKKFYKNMGLKPLSIRMETIL